MMPQSKTLNDRKRRAFNMTDLLSIDADAACTGSVAQTCAAAEQIADLVQPLVAQATLIRLRLAADDWVGAAAELGLISATHLLHELRRLEELAYGLGEAGQALQRVLERPARC